MAREGKTKKMNMHRGETEGRSEASGKKKTVKKGNELQKVNSEGRKEHA